MGAMLKWGAGGAAVALLAAMTAGAVQAQNAPAAPAAAPAADPNAIPPSGSINTRQAPRKPRTLFNDPDPTLALTGGFGGATGPLKPREGAPPNPDPHNFEGVWWLRGYEYLLGPEPGVPAPLKPQYIELLKKRIREKNAGKPETDTSTACFPHGMPRLMESPYPIEIVQTPGRVTFLHEVAHEVRRIYLDQKQPANLKESFLGHSVGHWEGDTLVVDTIGINDKSFIDDEGEAHSNKEHLTERYRKIDGGRQIELTMTVDDPVTLEHPYSYKRFYEWRPDVRPAEYICEENNRNAPVNGVTVAKMTSKTLSLLAAGAMLAALPALAHAQAKHPDFTGAWIVSPYKAALKPVDGSAVPLKPEAKKVYDQHRAAAAKGDRTWDDTSICLPEGLPRLETINEPFEIMQKDRAMYFVAQNRLPWRAFFNEKLPTDDPDPMYLGYHVAKWEGSKLVIDSAGFRDTSVLDDSGIPHTEKLHLTETYVMGPDKKTMTITYRIEDPDTFTHPWTAKATFKRMPASFQFPEEVCAAKLQSTAPKRD